VRDLVRDGESAFIFRVCAIHEDQALPAVSDEAATHVSATTVEAKRCTAPLEPTLDALQPELRQLD
jgi:hypothetical protein